MNTRQRKLYQRPCAERGQSTYRLLAVVVLSLCLPGCTLLGVELVDSAELAEETVDEAELDDALSRMVADL